MFFAVSLSPTCSTDRSKYDVNMMVEKQFYCCKRAGLGGIIAIISLDTDDTSSRNTSPQHCSLYLTLAWYQQYVTVAQNDYFK